MREGCCNSQRKEEPQGRERGAPEIKGEREREREWRTCVREKIK